jgi:hypothetical protein
MMQKIRVWGRKDLAHAELDSRRFRIFANHKSILAILADMARILR